MKGHERFYAGFACPQIGIDQAFLEYLIVDHARQTVEAFVEKYARYLERHSSGLTSALATGLPRETTFETVWHLAFGDLYAALFSEQMDSERAAGQVALRLHECGHPGEWRLQPSRCTQFCFAGWPLPPCDDVHVVATSDMVSIRILTGNTSRTITFERDSQDWRPTDSSAVPEAPARAARWPALTMESLSTESVSRLLKADAYNSAYEGADCNTDLLIHTCGAAQSVLSDFAPIYVPWVNQVVRCIVPLTERTGTLNSSSGNLAPGVISVSNQSNPYILAEMLVHEGTHQYLYIIKRLGPIDDGTDETLYFSPFRNMGRPILYIVFAYHAFANVLLFYRMLRAAGVTQAASGVDLDLQIKTLEQQLLTIEEALRSTRALTAIGRALWLPLAREIRK